MLRISELRPDDPNKNLYLVIYLDIKELDTASFESFLGDVKLQISLECRKHQKILDSDRISQYDREIFRGLLTRSSENANLRRSLYLLSMIYKVDYGSKVIILIDEYDNPVNNSYRRPHQKLILDYIKSMLTSRLKGNRALKLGVVTGVLQIAKESIFSGLNNLKVNNSMSTNVDEEFGFASEELRKLCTD